MSERPKDIRLNGLINVWVIKCLWSQNGLMNVFELTTEQCLGGQKLSINV